MVEKDRVIHVTNRDRGTVGYYIPDSGTNRQFMPRESKDITFGELEQLSWVPGGREILMNCLVLDDKEAITELIGSVEPEYFYSKEDIIRLMQTGTLDEFLDCLDFAPEGVIDIIKELAVSLPLNDVAKRDAILNKFNFNVSNAIKLTEEVKNEAAATSKRRVNTTGGEATRTTGRRIKSVTIQK